MVSREREILISPSTLASSEKEWWQDLSFLVSGSTRPTLAEITEALKYWRKGEPVCPEYSEFSNPWWRMRIKRLEEEGIPARETARRIIFGQEKMGLIWPVRKMRAAIELEFKKRGITSQTIREWLKRYSSLTEEEKRMVDGYYFCRAANVTLEETEAFRVLWEEGKRVFPQLIDSKHQVRCPVLRLRIARLEVEGWPATKTIRNIFWPPEN